MNKTKLSTGLLSLVGILMGAEAQASDFSLHLTNGANWDTAPWVTDGESLFPTRDDRITNISRSASTVNLHLNGDQEILSFNKVDETAFRIVSGSTSSSGASSLYVRESFTIKEGSIRFRSKDPDSKLTFSTQDLVLGSFGGTGSGGRAYLGESANYTFIDFQVRGSTTITGDNNAAFQVLSPGLGAQSKVDLGLLIFQDSSGGSAGVSAGEGQIEARGLRTLSRDGTTSESSGNASIQGSTKLVIYGDNNEQHTFNALIQGGISIVKQGSDTQILSRAAGSTYTGGTLISEGVLSVRNTTGSGIGKGAVIIEKGGVLAGGGAVALNAGNAVVVNGGQIAPGADGLGFSQLTFNGSHEHATRTSRLLVMNADSSFAFNIGSAVEHDSIRFLYFKPDDLFLSENGIVINITGTLEEGVFYQLFTFQTGSANSSFTSSGLTGGLMMGTGFDGYTATFHYDDANFGGKGVIGMTVTAIPEPSALAALLPIAFILSIAVGRTQWRERHSIQ